MKVRTLQSQDLETAGAILHQGAARMVEASGNNPWSSEEQAAQTLLRYRQANPQHVVVAEEGGALVGVGALRVRGEIASLGPIATYVDGRGIGGAIVDALAELADQIGVTATRVYVDASMANAYALYGSRGFAVTDVVANVARAPAAVPPLGSARGLEVRPFTANDVNEVARLDNKLTGHDRGRDLANVVRLVARRRNAIVGYLGATRSHQGVALGPALAVDASDLFTLITTALHVSGRDESWADPKAEVFARLSTAAPAAPMAAIALGFRVRTLGIVMLRGAPPPARPPQLYAPTPEPL